MRTTTSQQTFSQHDWANLTTAALRKRHGHHRIRKCRNCGALERYDTNTLKRVWQAGPLILDQPIQCDAWHKKLARQIGLKYLPYKLAGEFTEAELAEAAISDAEFKAELDAAEATEGGGE